VDESTGVASVLTSAAPPLGFTMAFYNGVLYAGAQGTNTGPMPIYTVDTSTGVFTTFATIPVGTGDWFPGLWFDPSGNLYFNVETDTTVYKVTPAGVVSAFITADGHLTSSDNNAQGTCDGSGNHYIADRGGFEILHYSSTGTYLATLTTSCLPLGIAVASDGNLLYTCYDANVYKLDLGTLANSTFATLSGAALAYLSVDPTGNVYAAQWPANTAWKLSPTGATLWSVTLTAPNGLAF
jgi:streptogramin lyase